MAYLRLHRSWRICPGVRLNLSKTGPSITVGVKGIHHNIRLDGSTRTTLSLPGTGLSLIERRSGARRPAAPLPAPTPAPHPRRLTGRLVLAAILTWVAAAAAIMQLLGTPT
jgi:Protein of unknown function (DUF4236)